MATLMRYPGTIPPPPGVTANVVDPDSRANVDIVVHTICLTFATATLCIRLYTRGFISHTLGWDDFCLVLAYVLSVVFSALLITADVHGLARHLWDLPPQRTPYLFKITFVSEPVYLVLVATVKMSYLLFYRRLFSPALVMRRTIDLSILLLLCTYVALTFWTVFLCIPIKKSWIRSTSGHCGTPKILPYTAASVNMLSDLYILILPIPCIWALNMKINRRLRVLSVFGLGAFVCATSIVRLTQSSILYTNADLSWNASRITIFSVLEVNVGIICASLLAFPAFLDRYNKLRLPTSLKKLLSSFSSLRRKSATSHDALGVAKPAADLQKSRSREIMLKADNYACLAEKKKNLTDTIPLTTMAKTNNREWTSSNSMDTKFDDSLALVDSRGQLALQTSYPPTAHVSARDAYERTNSIALRYV